MSDHADQAATAVLPTSTPDPEPDFRPPAAESEPARSEPVWTPPPSAPERFAGLNETPTSRLVTLDPATLVLARLDQQLDWYVRAARRTRVWYQVIKIIQLMLAAGVPVAVVISAPGGVTGGLGAAIVVLEGIQQLFQFQSNWVRYSNTRSGLERQKFLFLSQAGDYADPSTRVATLAERIEELVRSETSSWASIANRTPATPTAG